MCDENARTKIYSIYEELKQKSKSVRFMPMEDVIEIVGKVEESLKCTKEGMTRLPERINNKWISVSESLPEEHDSIFARFKGTDKWSEAMCEKISNLVLVTVTYEDGSALVTCGKLRDGEWKTNLVWPKNIRFLGNCHITAWMPLPEPYKLAEVKEDE